jgi:hypothetical protein
MKPAGEECGRGPLSIAGDGANPHRQASRGDERAVPADRCAVEQVSHRCSPSGRKLFRPGPVNRFHDDANERKGHDGTDASRRLLAPERHALEAVDLADPTLSSLKTHELGCDQVQSGEGGCLQYGHVNPMAAGIRLSRRVFPYGSHNPTVRRKVWFDTDGAP